MGGGVVMNGFAPRARRISVFHVRMGGCAGCGEMVDTLLRDRIRGAPRLSECDSPRHADLLVVTGFPAEELDRAALTVVSQAPSARRLVVVGDCALGGATPADRLREAGGVARYLEPDRELPGCPVALESIIEGVLDVAR
jgi:Ni,Fe-hydrogenase III small subunit